MKDFLNENLKKGYISQSNSPWSMPAFFIKKTGRGFRPIFNYRQVNNWTTKDILYTPSLTLITSSTNYMELVS
jgi:hypothetical protein